MITVITSNYGVQFEIHPNIDKEYASKYQANAEKLFCPTIGAPCTYAVISEVMGNLCSYRKSSYKSTYKSIVSS